LNATLVVNYDDLTWKPNNDGWTEVAKLRPIEGRLFLDRILITRLVEDHDSLELSHDSTVSLDGTMLLPNGVVLDVELVRECEEAVTRRGGFLWLQKHEEIVNVEYTYNWKYSYWMLRASGDDAYSFDGMGWR
jgi:hypothetical protein